MTEDRLPLAELMQKAGDDDFLRTVAEAVVQLLLEADVDGLVPRSGSNALALRELGAGRHERSAERQTYRNGFRDRALDTRLGTLQLRIPKLRSGPAYFPPFLEPRKTSERALVAVIQEACANPSDFAWIGGVSTRKIDDLVQAVSRNRRNPKGVRLRRCRLSLRRTGISKSTVSKLCKDIDERVHAFLDRPLSGDWPYLWLDATYLKQREVRQSTCFAEGASCPSRP